MPRRVQLLLSRSEPWGKGWVSPSSLSPALSADACLLRMRRESRRCVLTRPAGGGGRSRFLPRPQAAFGNERVTSQGSQQPPGSPLSREEGEAPPPAPAPEGRRRSRRVRLRGSCRHRPSFLGRRELASSATAGPAPASAEVSQIGNNGERGRGSASRHPPWNGRGPHTPALGPCGPGGRLRRAPVDWRGWAGEGAFLVALPRGASPAVYWKERGLRVVASPRVGAVTLAGPNP